MYLCINCKEEEVSQDGQICEECGSKECVLCYMDREFFILYDGIYICSSCFLYSVKKQRVLKRDNEKKESLKEANEIIKEHYGEDYEKGRPQLAVCHYCSEFKVLIDGYICSDCENKFFG